MAPYPRRSNTWSGRRPSAGRVCSAVFALALVSTLVACGPAKPPPQARPARIQIRTIGGVAEFYDTVTGVRFTPRGHNLVEFRHIDDPVFGVVDHDMVLSPAAYDQAHIRGDLEAMHALGYNAVRVMLETCGALDCIYPYGATGRVLNAAYLDNIADLLQLAADTDMYVWITSNTLPDIGYYLEYGYSGETATISAGEATFLTATGIDAYRQYLQDLLRELVARDARLDRMFSLSLRNEHSYDTRYLPWTLTSGTVTPANGDSYDMALPSERKRLAEDGLIYWTDRLTEAVKEVVPAALVSIGFFPPDAPNPWRPGDFRLVETSREIHESTADFFDLHAYPAPLGYSLAKLLENFGAVGFQAKPLVMGEFGAFRSQYPDEYVAAQAMVDWQNDGCQSVYDGWLTWHWHGDTIEGLWGSEGTPLGQALAPALHPDPCSPVTVPNPNLAYLRPVIASNALPDEPASNAVDGTGAQWGSGNDAPQWLEIDFGAPVELGSVRLTVAQYPAGHTVHELYGGATSPATSLLHTFSGTTADGAVLVHTFGTPPTVRYLRVLTTSSVSWVAWQEIQAFAP